MHGRKGWKLKITYEYETTLLHLSHFINSRFDSDLAISGMTKQQYHLVLTEIVFTRA